MTVIPITVTPRADSVAESPGGIVFPVPVDDLVVELALEGGADGKNGERHDLLAGGVRDRVVEKDLQERVSVSRVRSGNGRRSRRGSVAGRPVSPWPRPDRKSDRMAPGPVGEPRSRDQGTQGLGSFDRECGKQCRLDAPRGRVGNRDRSAFRPSRRVEGVGSTPCDRSQELRERPSTHQDEEGLTAGPQDLRQRALPRLDRNTVHGSEIGVDSVKALREHRGQKVRRPGTRGGCASPSPFPARRRSWRRRGRCPGPRSRSLEAIQRRRPFRIRYREGPNLASPSVRSVPPGETERAFPPANGRKSSHKRRPYRRRGPAAPPPQPGLGTPFKPSISKAESAEPACGHRGTSAEGKPPKVPLSRSGEP